MRFSPTELILCGAAAHYKPGRPPFSQGCQHHSTTPVSALGRATVSAYFDGVRLIAVVVFSLTAGCFLSGCAGDDYAEGIRVETTEMKFSPSKLTVAAGTQTVTVKNTGLVRHTFSINSLGREVTVPPGKTLSLEVDLAPGTYRYVCRVLDHEGLGMRGVLTVRN